MNGHSRLRAAWRERPVLLVLGTRLDLFPRGRGGAVEGSVPFVFFVLRLEYFGGKREYVL